MSRRQLAFLSQAVALMIALVMPLSPGKTGSGRGMAELFFPDPGYLLRVVVAFVFVNLLMALLALVLRGLVRWDEWRDGG